jgi:hypothetical protein
MGPFVVQPETRSANLSQERRAVDLQLEIIGIKLLDGTRNRAKSGQMLADRLLIEPPQPGVLRNQTGRTGRGRVEMVLEIQVGPAEIVDRRVRYYRVWLNAYLRQLAPTARPLLRIDRRYWRSLRNHRGSPHFPAAIRRG